ncbi:MAG: replicative DNA helicase [Candidatus Paceibacterota bacterium]
MAEVTPFTTPVATSKRLRTPPHDLDAERALLGAIILKPDTMHDVSTIVHPESFYADKHHEVYRAIMNLFTKGDPIDLLSVSTTLKSMKQLERIGGASYLSELIENVPAAGNAVYYAGLVHGKAILRGLIEAADEIAELGFSDPDSVEEVLDQAEKKVYNVTNASVSQKFKTIGSSLSEAWERFEHLSANHEELRGVPTGFASLDNLLSGLQKSDLIILAARPSMGKTTFALDLARNAALKYKASVGIFSLEMSDQQLVDRMLAAEAGVDSWKLRTGRLKSDDEYEALQSAMTRLAEAPIHIVDQPGNNILNMRSAARRLKNEHSLDLIIVDYLQLMNPTATKASDSMVQQVTEISRSLKTLARELDVPVLALSQLSRAVEQRGGKPRLSDLRDSGCLTGDTLVQRADTGERVPIETLIGQTDIPVVTMDASYRLRPMLASKIFSSGRKRVFEMTLRSGRTIKASGNHKFLTLHGWQRLDALQENDRLATPRLLTATEAPSRLSTQELILLAHLIGDGCVLPRQPIHYTSADPKNLDAVEHAAKELFNIVPRRVAQSNWWHTYLSSPYRLTHGKRNPITTWYAALGIQPVRSYEKRVPQAVFASDSMSIQLFLHHLWATDGNVSWKKLPGRLPAAAIYYGTTSRGLAEDVQHLLLRLGIWSTVRTTTKRGYRPSYHVHVQSAPVQQRFLELVGCFGSRGAVVPELKEALANIAPVTNTDTVPREVWDLVIKPEQAERGVTGRELATLMQTAYNGTAVTAAGISRPRLTKLAAVLGSERLSHLAESDVYWDEVKTIKPLGVEEVYDMTVPGTHNFVAGDIIVHNSIEQDADVVMFIHREDKQNKESERPNIAEILIEKHRNGPVGMAELYFDEKHVRFLNLDTHHTADSTNSDDF